MIPTETTPVAIAEEEPSIDLRQYLALFGHWWWLIALATILAGLAAFLFSSRQTPIYQASTTLLINQAPNNQYASYDTLLTNELLAQTYAQMITKRPVLEKTIQRLGASITPDELGGMITASPVKDTQLLTIDVTGPDANLDATVANALYMVFAENLSETQSTRYASSLDSLKKQLSDAETQLNQARAALEKTKDATETARLETRINQYEQIYSNLLVSYEDVRMADAQSSSSVYQVEQATVPSGPISPNPGRNGLLAAAVGCMLAVGGIFAVDALDDTVKSPDELQRQLRLPIMGTIARYDEPEDGQLITRAQPRSPIAESFRSLRTNVQYASVDRPLRTLLITSPAPADGKTTVLANLATVISQGGRRVTALDADLHRPRLHRVFKTDARPGLSALFIKPTIRLNGSFQPTATERLHIVASGELPPNPSELLGSNKMREILNAVLDESDLVMLDTPPVLSVTDAVVLAPIVDGVLIVVRPGVTKMNALKYVVEQLRYVGANIVGVVLNGIDNKSSRYGYYYKSYYYKQYKYYRTNGKQPAARPTVTPASAKVETLPVEYEN